jgi:large subunit ribosomal protein L19
MLNSSSVMHQTIQKVENNYRKKQVVDVRSGDTVRVHQKIKEGEKERVQVFEGFVIRTDRKNSLTSRITVRRIASGVGVEKSFMLHSPLVTKVEVVKRAKVRRNYLSYMRERSGKRARLAGVDFDKEAVNTLEEMMDKEVGEAAEAKNTDVTKKEKNEELPVEEKVEDEKSEEKAPADEKPAAEEKKEETPKVEKTEEPKEEKKELSKKEKAEAFRKEQEEKKK